MGQVRALGLPVALVTRSLTSWTVMSVPGQSPGQQGALLASPLLRPACLGWAHTSGCNSSVCSPERPCAVCMAPCCVSWGTWAS